MNLDEYDLLGIRPAALIAGVDRRAMRHMADVQDGPLSLIEFVRTYWRVIEPKEFIENWHHRLICDQLEAVSRGDCRRLIVNVPPKTSKSTITSVLWPVWHAAEVNDRDRVLSTSHAANLVTRDSMRARRLIESMAFRKRYKNIEIRKDQNAKGRYDFLSGGGRVTGSVGSGITGEGGDIIIIDDPHDAARVQSETDRENVKEWFDYKLFNRINDPDRSSIVVIMQRLHQEDLTGHLLATGEWEHVCLPMEYDPDMAHPADPRIGYEGHLLWPDHISESVIAELKSKGDYFWAGQYQQRPVPKGGAIFKRDWFGWYDEEPEKFDRVLHSWDLTFKKTASGSFVAGLTVGLVGQDCYVLAEFHDRVGFTASAQAVKHARDNRPGAVLIENKANGAAVEDSLRHEVPGILMVNPGGDKEARAHAVTPYVQGGSVLLPRGASWIMAWLDEVCTFPRHKHDDRVDALTQLLNYAYNGPALFIPKSGKPNGQNKPRQKNVAALNRRQRRA